MEGLASLEARIARPAELRSSEGYMADWQRDEDGRYILCRKPLSGLRRSGAPPGALPFGTADLSLLGPQAIVERTDHILAGARRCAYRVTPA